MTYYKKLQFAGLERKRLVLTDLIDKGRNKKELDEKSFLAI